MFDQIKQKILENLGVVDYSPKGSVDKEIVELINIVNFNKDLVTTSSCAGRVSVFIEGNKDIGKLKIGGKGEGGHWLFFTHDKNELVPQWRRGLDEYVHSADVGINGIKRYVLYKFEPFILHVKCRDFNTAKQLFSMALQCGFRESGIGSNNNVAIRISLKIDAPVGYLKGNRIHRICSDEYLAELDKMALDMFDKNKQRIDQLTEEFRRFEVKPEAESREARRLRLRSLGLQRREHGHEHGGEGEHEVEYEVGGLFV